jgi:hypothetical protein
MIVRAAECLSLMHAAASRGGAGTGAASGLCLSGCNEGSKRSGTGE